MKLHAVFSIAVALALLAAATAALAQGKCTNVKAKCAMEIGGQCDPKTGRWFYGYFQGKYAGGTTQAFLACLDRAKAKTK